jgi:hypothetical protein
MAIGWGGDLYWAGRSLLLKAFTKLQRVRETLAIARALYVSDYDPEYMNLY